MGTGATFTTPLINANATYYAVAEKYTVAPAAASLSAIPALGKPTVSQNVHGLFISSADAATINSADIYPRTGNTSFTVALEDKLGGTVIATQDFTVDPSEASENGDVKKHFILQDSMYLLVLKIGILLSIPLLQVLEQLRIFGTRIWVLLQTNNVYT